LASKHVSTISMVSFGGKRHGTLGPGVDVLLVEVGALPVSGTLFRRVRARNMREQREMQLKGTSIVSTLPNEPKK